MANCHVLEAHQKPTDRPSRRIKRSGGHSLVNRGLAVWLKDNILLQMAPAAKQVFPRLTMPATRKLFIPDRMPSPEVKGCYFEDPRFPNRPMEFIPNA